MTLTIRRATVADIADLLRLIEEYWRVEGIGGFDAARVQAELERLFSEPRLGGAWIAVTDDGPVGYLLAVYVFSLEHLGLTAEIDEFFVRRAARGRGFGRRLLQAAEATFMAAGCTNISLQLARGNVAGRAFYERHGYASRSGYELLEKDWVRAVLGEAAREPQRLAAARPLAGIAGAYREDLAYIHDEGYGALARDAAKRLLDELSRAGLRQGTVVDLGCGSGILARAVADARYRVLGIDLSAAMVTLARARVPEAEFRAASFLSVDLPPSVAISAIGEVFNYAFDPANDTAARESLFRRVHDALVPGGLLLFDVAGPERANQGSIRTWAEGPDWAVLVDSAVDSGTRVLTRCITTFRRAGPDYRRDAEVHRLTLLEPSNVADSLRGVGFSVDTIVAYGAEPLPPGVTAFVARKGVSKSGHAKTG